MPSLELTKEERERRSEQAKALHAEGKFGGAQPGSGRPRKARASQLIAEKTADEAEAIFDRLMTVVRHGNDTNAISASAHLLRIEEQEQQRKEKTQERIEDLRRDELLAMVIDQLGDMIDGGQLPDFIEGVAWEEEDLRIEGPSETTSSSE